MGVNNNSLPVDRRILKIHISTVRHAPFYGEVLQALRATRDDSKAPTACTDGLVIYYNQKFMEGLTYEENTFVLFHELYHILLTHPSRLGTKNPFVWNLATDAIINDRLEYDVNPNLSSECRFEVLKNSFRLKHSTLEGKTEVDVYRELMKSYEKQEESLKQQIMDAIKDAQNQQNNGGQSGSNQTDDNQSGSNQTDNPFSKIKGSFKANVFGEEVDIPFGNITIDVFSPKGGQSASDAVVNKVRGIASAARTRAKMAGNMSADVERLCGEILKGTTVKWYNYVKRYLTAMIEDDDDYATPERSRLWEGVILPGPYEEDKALEDIEVVFDLSGSIGKDEQEEFFFQLKNIMKDFKTTGRLLTFDTKVCSDIPITPDTKIESLKLRGGGGTDFNCVPEHNKRNKYKYSVMIVLTDGYLYDKPKRCHDVIWVITKGGASNFKPSFGKVIYLDNIAR